MIVVNVLLPAILVPLFGKFAVTNGIVLDPEVAVVLDRNPPAFIETFGASVDVGSVGNRTSATSFSKKRSAPFTFTKNVEPVEPRIVLPGKVMVPKPTGGLILMLLKTLRSLIAMPDKAVGFDNTFDQVGLTLLNDCN